MSRASVPSPVELVGPLSRMTAGEQARYLDRVCEGNPALRAEVESLLGHLRADQEFLERGPLSGPLISPHLIPEHPDILPPGTQVSRYRVERILGEGGMGVVYLAQQENPSREVALKVVRAAVSSPSLLRRFQREAQVMGRLQHPGIAQIFEAGAADIGGSRQPFLAMEYVRGLPLTKHVSERKLGTRQRLEILALVCDAVQHAHDRGLIHRDLKPGNILVDEAGRPKVLDFGVARAAEPDAPGTTIATDVGQLIGTLAYMSPEQVGADPSKLGTRSDVYALGAILYECLAGRAPLTVRSDALPEAVRVIREDAPARLSSISRVFRGDIETIVAKAMEKDPARRYQSAADLGKDVRRYLAGEPIAAKQDSTLYVLQNRVRRYRWAVGAGAVFALMVAGFAVRSLVQARDMKALAAGEHAASTAARASAARASAAERARTLELRASDIERGRLMSRTGDAAGAESLLWRAHVQDPTSEHSLWALREHYANAPCLSTFRVGPSNVRSVSFEPGGGSAVVCGWEGCMEVWDLSRDKLLRTFSGPKAVGSSAINPAGWLIAGGRTEPVTIWDPRRGTRIGALTTTTVDRYVAISPDGLLAATGGPTGRITIFSVPLMGSLGSFQAHEGEIVAIEFSPDGRRLATGGRDKAARLWDVATHQCLGQSTDQSGAVTDLAFARDGQRIACGSSNWGARVWDLRDDSVRIVADDLGIVRRVAFLKNDSLLAALGEWGISLFDGQSLAYLKDLGNHGEPVTRIEVGPDGHKLLSLSRDSHVKIWDFSPDGPATWLCSERGRSHGDLNVGAASGDGNLIATVSGSGGAELWDRAGRFIRWLPGPAVGQVDVSVNAVGTLVAGAANDGIVRIWRSESAAAAMELRGHAGPVNCVRFAPSGNLLASCGDDGKVRLWDAESGRPERVIDPGSAGRVYRVRFSAGGDVVLASTARRVWMWRTRTGEALAPLPLGDSDIYSVDASPDGRTIAVGYRRRTIGLFDLGTGRHIADLTGHTELPWNMTFSTDGRLLLSCTAAGSLKIWEVLTGRCLASFRDDAHGWIMPVSFIPGTDTVLVGHQRRGVSIWDMTYYDRHIRGNAEEQLGRLGAELGAQAVVPAREWLKGAALLPHRR